MNALWNKKDLERPANNIWIANRKAIGDKKLISTLDSIIKDLESQNALHLEAAILSRLIYRMKSKFRNDKGLKNMEKVNRALLNYLEIDLLKEYKDLKNYIEPDGLVVNLPTKQMMQYVLIRTQGFAKLMCRIENVAKCSAEFFKARIQIGHAWTVSAIAYAVVSRIWYLSRYLVKRCCAWYNSIIEHVAKFRVVGPIWLPDNYEFPLNLKTWLDLPWIDQATDSVPLKDDGKETIFGLIRTQMDDLCELNDIENEDIESASKSFNDSIEVIRNDLKSDKEIIKEENEVLIVEDDIGTSIDRETFQLNPLSEVSDTLEPIPSEENLKKKIERVSIEVLAESEVEDTVVPVSAKRRKKLLKTDEKKYEKSFDLSEINSMCGEKLKKRKSVTTVEIKEVKTALKNNKLKSRKAEKKSGKIGTVSSSPGKQTKLSIYRDIKTRDDLTALLSKDSYPGLDKLQWNMLTKSVKKLITKFERCGPLDEKRQRILLKKVNCQLQNWIK